MSLLMDALRRAEQQKKQQQARAERERGDDLDAARVDESPLAGQPPSPPTPPTIGSEDATMQVEPAAIDRASGAFDEAAKAAVPPASDADAPRGSMSSLAALELEAFDHLEDEATGALLALEPIDRATTDASARFALNPQSADLTAGTTFDAAAHGQPGAPAPSARARQGDFDAYFDQSQTGAAPDPAARGDLTLEDVAGHTVVNAETIFTAGQRPRSRPLFVAVALLAVLIVAGIGIAGMLYAGKSPGPRYMPPPTVAEGVERPAQRELPVMPVAPVEPAPPRPAQAAAVMPTAPASAVATTEQPAPPLPSPPLVSTPVVSTPSTAAGDAVSSASAVAPAAAPRTETRAAPSAPIRDVGAGEVSIARSPRGTRIDDHLGAAYAAFQAGEFERAETAYRAVLAQRPEQRDAHLGLGAIALARGDYQRAYAEYAAVLKANPNDSVASTALFSLTGAQGEATAARLRMLRDADGGAPYVHFALGNWYARQGRWADAQQAYFEAVHRAPENADYAFNLAVSLDHMGQGRAAREHYQRALELAERNPGAFDSAAALARISALNHSEAGASASPGERP